MYVYKCSIIMEKVKDKSPSPAESDITPAQLTTSGLTKTIPSNSPSSSNVVTLEPYCPTPRNQKPKNSGAINSNSRVLYCSGLPLSMNYKSLFSCLKTFGIIERMKMKLSANKDSFDAYITYSNQSEAKEAHSAINSSNVPEIPNHSELYHSDNINDSEFDFIPKFS